MIIKAIENNKNQSINSIIQKDIFQDINLNKDILFKALGELYYKYNQLSSNLQFTEEAINTILNQIKEIEDERQ